MSFNGVVLSFVDKFMNILYQFIWIATSHFGKEMVITLLYIFCKQN